jgi:MoaA/NifB/PqqE/SkfB family radical SAM enzyme
MPDFAVPRTTTRAMIDPTRLCSLRCSFCYYAPSDEFYSVKTWENQAKEITDAAGRGCNACDITGGEPMQNPHVVELVKLAVENRVFPRIITSLICPEAVLDGVLDAGVSDWLISMHGAKDETHNEIVKVPKARHFQVRRLAKIAARMDYCCNYVMVEKNQSEMAGWARWITSRDHQPPKVVNFINFNPFGPWLKSPEWMARGKENIADPRIAGPILTEAIDILEAAGIGVNCRYLPMCFVAERHRKNICNDLHVAFDQGEWDNAFGATTDPLFVFNNYSVPLSNRNEMKTEPCSGCGHQFICGGANRVWHQLATEKFGSEPLTPIERPPGVEDRDFWHYRKENVMGLDPRRLT